MRGFWLVVIFAVLGGGSALAQTVTLTFVSDGSGIGLSGTGTDAASMSLGTVQAFGAWSPAEFTLPAIRALTGVVEGYDPGKGQYVPVENATVELVELKRKTVTDGKGWYTFRNMPSGTYSVTVNDQPHGQVSFGVGPQLLRHDIRLNPEALAISRK
jgi:Carboxypeptidase regulatory-like domain